MKVKSKRVGDIYLNPVAGDLWILNKVWSDVEEKDVWMLNLVHDDYQENLDFVDKFIKVGNIYNLVDKELKKGLSKKI